MVGARVPTHGRVVHTSGKVTLVTERELALRRAIMSAFVATGAPPALADEPALRALADQHLVVLEDGPGGAPVVRMAHPFAGHREGARVDAAGHTWWGNCAWDGFGILAALGLTDATVTAQGLSVAVRAGRVLDDGTVFHVAVAAREWWVDIGFT